MLREFDFVLFGRKYEEGKLSKKLLAETQKNNIEWLQDRYNTHFTTFSGKRRIIVKLDETSKAGYKIMRVYDNLIVVYEETTKEVNAVDKLYNTLVKKRLKQIE